MRIRSAALVVAATSIVLGVTACTNTPAEEPVAPAPGTTAPGVAPAPTDGNGSPSPTATAEGGCYVHLFDGDDFDSSDDNFQLTTAGEYSDLTSLPGATQDWTDEADSIQVGPGATVTIWTETGFQGTETTLDPGSQQPSLDHGPSSLKMTC